MPWVSSGSSGDIWVCTGGHPVHPVSLASLLCTVGVVGFVRGDWVDWGASWPSSGSSVVAEFIWVCAGDRRVRPGSLG